MQEVQVGLSREAIVKNRTELVVDYDAIVDRHRVCTFPLMDESAGKYSGFSSWRLHDTGGRLGIG